MTGLDWSGPAAWAVAGLVSAAFVALAINDARTWRVPVRHSMGVTGLAVGGLGLVAVMAGRWSALITAALAAVVIVSIQLVPYGLQRGQGGGAIGKADVRLAVPFGWTLGHFGFGFALTGFAVALVAGLAVALVTGRRKLPFVPFLALGLLAGLGLAAASGPPGG